MMPLRPLISTGMVLGSGLGMILGQVPAAPPSVPDFWSGMVDTLVRALGPLAILGWYLYHDQTVTVPKRDKAREEAEARASQILIDQAKSVTAERLAVAEEHRKAIERLVDEVKAGRETMIEMIRKCGAHPVGA